MSEEQEVVCTLRTTTELPETELVKYTGPDTGCCDCGEPVKAGDRVVLVDEGVLCDYCDNEATVWASIHSMCGGYGGLP